jgi:hypothetical protein
MPKATGDCCTGGTILSAATVGTVDDDIDEARVLRVMGAGCC